VRARAAWTKAQDAKEALRAFPRWMHAERSVLEGSRSHQASSDQIAIFRSLMCTGSRRNPATCGFI